MSERTWGDLPTPNIYKELKGEFVTFNEEEEYLECKYPIQEKYCLLYTSDAADE